MAVENARLFQQAQDEWPLGGRAEAEKEAFLDAVAHDLGNSLTTVKGQAQLSASRTRSRRFGDPGGGSLQRVKMGHPVVGELTEYRVSSRWPRPRGQAAAGHPLHLEAGVAEGVGLWDADRLTRVLENLVANAVKYSSSGSTVVVRLTAKRGPTARCVLSIAVKESASRPPTCPTCSSASAVVATWPVPAGRWVMGQPAPSWRTRCGTIAIDSTEGRGTTVTAAPPPARSPWRHTRRRPSHADIETTAAPRAPTDLPLSSR